MGIVSEKQHVHNLVNCALYNDLKIIAVMKGTYITVILDEALSEFIDNYENDKIESFELKPKYSQKKQKAMNFYVKEDLYEKIKKIAHLEKIKIKKVMEKSIADYIIKEKKQIEF
ncbi:MAG: hypothetical protein ACOCQR_02770 [bacterium]